MSPSVKQAKGDVGVILCDAKKCLQAVKAVAAKGCRRLVLAACEHEIFDPALNVALKRVRIRDGIFNMVEMAFRAYDPCFSCATHAAIGQLPMQIVLRDNAGNEIRRITRD